MRRQLVPGPVVRLTVIKAKTRPGIEASVHVSQLTDNSCIFNIESESDLVKLFVITESLQEHIHKHLLPKIRDLL